MYFTIIINLIKLYQILRVGNSLVSVLSSIFADENNLDEANYLNLESNICETTSSNIFIAKDKQFNDTTFKFWLC